MTNATIGPKLTRRKTAAGMLEFFYERFDMKHATDSELQFLVGYVDVVADMALSLAQLAGDMGCFLSRDSEAPSPLAAPPSDESTSDILFHVAQQIELISRIALIASETEFTLRKRLLDRLKVERSRRGQCNEYSSEEVA